VIDRAGALLDIRFSCVIVRDKNRDYKNCAAARFTNHKSGLREDKDVLCVSIAGSQLQGCAMTSDNVLDLVLVDDQSMEA